MAAHPVIHPPTDALRAFALGKANDSTSAALMNHLDNCPDCCKIVAGLSGDDFLHRLRQARGPGATPAPARGLDESASDPKPSPNQHALPDLPNELADNPQYEIVRELGRGGMGVVYLAKNKLMERLEVLKVVNRALLDHPAAVERFLREIRSAAKLSHANVVTAYSALQSGELLAFAMEYIEGQDLASLVKSQGPLPIPHACFYVQQAAHGLQHAFEKGMVHRDIKPQNLILAREGKKHIVKVLDFGLAKVIREKKDDTGLTGEGKMLGTPDYIAPEQTLDAAHADIRADIYSLGCTLYYLLSGHPPFSASSLGAILVAHQMHEAKPLNLVRPEVPEELAAVVRRMMAKSPPKRYQTPRDAAQALAPFIKPGAMAKPAAELSSGEAKPAVMQMIRVDPPPAPTAQAAKTQVANVFAGACKSVVVHNRGDATAKERSSRPRWLLGGGIGVGVLLLALLGMWAGGVIKVKTPEGTIVLENLPADAEVTVDGAKVTVAWGDGGKKAEIRVKPGTRKIVATTRDGVKVIGDEVEIADGGRQVLTARLEPIVIKPNDDPKPKPREKQLEDLLVAGSTWKGPGSLWDGSLVLYVQQRTRSTFRAVHAYHWVVDGEFQNFVRHVQGEVKGNTLNYHSTGSDRFRVSGTWKSDCLEITHQNFDGIEATAKLKPDEAKSTSAYCVVSVFRRNDPEGWYTLNQDLTERATHPIVVDSSKNLGIEHDDFYWLVARHLPDNRNEWGWHAPEKFHGDHSGKYGRCLIYEICCGQTGETPRTEWYVVLRGSGMTLFVDGTTSEPPAPKNIWKVYRIRLDTSAGWKKYPGLEPASADDIKTVLADVTDLRIKGNYGRISGGCLRSVEFGVEDPFEKR